MPFNKTHLKKFGISLLSFVLADLLTVLILLAAFVVMGAIKDGDFLQAFFMALFGMGLGAIFGGPFALIGSMFYIFKKSKTNWLRLHLIAFALGVLAWVTSKQTIGIGMDHVVIAAMTIGPQIMFFLIRFFDKKWIQT